MTSTEKIIQKARELIDATPQGKRYSELHREICALLPDIPSNTVHGALHKFRSELPDTYYLPVRGLYRHTEFKGQDEPAPIPVKSNKSSKVKEEDFYEPFADWIVNELEEATKAIALGGNRFKDKWGTPDVIAVREARRSDIIRPPTEIISAEIKLDIAGLITAFGQCCAYKLFSHKTYLVVPASASDEDIARLDSLARIFGVGLVLFDSDSPKNPEFTIRSRASREEPDMFYVNKYLRLVEDDLFA